MHNKRNGQSLLLISVLVLIAIIIAWSNRFVQDDAFISFTYAKNLVNGQGLTWNNLRIEGYTNFLWVLLMAIPEIFKINTVLFSQITGIIFYFLTLICIVKICNKIFTNSFKTFAILLLLGSNFSVISYATSGLETSLQTFLITFAFLLVIKLDENRYQNSIFIIASIISALGVMTRLDTAIPLALFLLFSLFKKNISQKQLACLLAPFVVIISSWVYFKIIYYGNVLPNSFYAKTGAGIAALVNGFIYIGRFFHWYMLWPFILGWILITLFKKNSIPVVSYRLLATISLWLSYVIIVGGDFMEFRFIMPIAPLLFIFITEAIFKVSELAGSLNKIVCSIFIMVIILFSWNHARTFIGVIKGGSLDCISDLKTYYRVYPNEEWGLIGNKLKHVFKNKKIKIALRPVGTIAYYSELNIFDMWGINNPYVANNGVRFHTSSFRPGHIKTASISYMKKAGVDIIIDHPVLVGNNIVNDPRANEFLIKWALRSKTSADKLRTKATVFLIPLSKEKGLLAMHINTNKEVTKIIDKNNWEKALIEF